MTIFETFLSFAQRLPADQRESVEDALAALMESYSERYDLSASELDKLDRRIADPAPAFSDPEEIARLLGKRFSA